MSEPSIDLPFLSLYHSLSGQSIFYSACQTAHPTPQRSDVQIPRGVPVVAVMGATGTGKSTFVKIATGADHIQIGNMLTPCTQKIQVAQCCNQSRNSDILFVDIPGFDDTWGSDAGVLEGIAKWLQDTYKAGIKLSGILYLHRITDNRMSNTLLRNLLIFQKLCGSDALSNVTLITTHWDQLQDVEEGVRNEEQLRDNYWGLFLRGGSQMLRFEHTFASAWKIINSLSMIQMPLEIQREMVDQGKLLADTAAGQCLIGWFVSVTKALRAFVRRLERLGKKVKSSTGGDGAEGANLQKALNEAKANLNEIREQWSRVLGSVDVQSRGGIRAPRLHSRSSPPHVNLNPGSVKSISLEVSTNALHASTSTSFPNEVPIFAFPQSPPPAPGNDGDPTKVGGISENLQRHLSGLISEIARRKNSRIAFCGALSNGEGVRVRAQAVADYLNTILHDPGILKQNDRPNVLRLFCELAKSAEVYPRCYVLEGIHMDVQPTHAGGFGDVFKGKYEGQTVCCKVLRNGCHSASILRKHANEIVLWSHASHKNVLPFHGVHVLENSVQRISLISPWMRNGNLRQYLRDSPKTSRVPLVQGVIDGLMYLHESEIAHGDLKAENILVSDDGRALISDFGLSSTTMTVATGSGQSSTGGTTNWMAPELLSAATSPRKPTKESDIWSFGCVCYEIFTGKRPFYHRRSTTEIVLALIGGEVPCRPETGGTLICAEFEGWIWEMMLGCWKKHPQDRYTGKTVQDLLKFKGTPGERGESSYSQPREGSAFQKAMRARFDIAVDYRFVESLLIEFLGARQGEGVHN